MNCVPGMVTEFALNQFIQLLSIEVPYMVRKVANINAIVLKVYWSCSAR
jgi:hypothetical protein